MREPEHVARQRRFYGDRAHDHLQARPDDFYASKLVDRLAAAVDLGGDERVLEVGAGFGRFTFDLLERCGSLTALDLSQVALDKLAAVRDERGISPDRCRTRCADLAHVDASALTERFDVIAGFFLLHHLPDVPTAIANLAPLLAPGGRIIFLEPNRRNPLFLLQVACCEDMTWAEEKGMFQLSARGVERSYRAAGLTAVRTGRFGFFPPQLLNASSAIRRVESGLERFSPLSPMLPFLLIQGNRTRVNDPEFELLDQIESTHWWFVGKRYILRSVLRNLPSGQRMLDLGCGTGGILRDWMGENRCYGIDRSELALRICAKQGFDVLARGDLRQVPVKAASLDTVLLLDVIEHLDDDVGFLKVAQELCVPGGRMVIAVPAFQLLWSQHDVTFEHHRRYSKRQLLEVVSAAGLEPERTTYTNSLLFPVALLWRTLSYRLGVGRFAPKHDFWPIPNWLNSLLAGLYRIEAWLLGRYDLPVGVSLICIARRPA